MKNPWDSRPLFIAATPIVGFLVQVLIMGLASGHSDPSPRYLNLFFGGLFIFGLILPAVSIPAFAAALKERKKEGNLAIQVAGVLLNAGYLIVLVIDVGMLIFPSVDHVQIRP